jgi:hypothetical protein
MLILVDADTVVTVAAVVPRSGYLSPPAEFWRNI